MKYSLAILLMFVFSAGIHSCQSTRKSIPELPVGEGSEVLFMHRWELVEMGGMPAPSAPRKPFVAFTPGQISRIAGNNGCNNFTGTIDLSGSGFIKISPLASTKMACMGDYDESVFFQTIGKTTEWRIVNNVLTLYDHEHMPLMRYTKANEATSKQASEVQGNLSGEWELNYISGSKIAFDGLFPNKKPTLVIDMAAGEASGNTSCNQYSCTFTINDRQINFNDAKTTRMFCEGGGETAYLSMLKKVNSFAISDNNTLNLLIGDIAVMRFERK